MSMVQACTILRAIFFVLSLFGHKIQDSRLKKYLFNPTSLDSSFKIQKKFPKAEKARYHTSQRLERQHGTNVTAASTSRSITALRVVPCRVDSDMEVDILKLCPQKFYLMERQFEDRAFSTWNGSASGCKEHAHQQRKSPKGMDEDLQTRHVYFLPRNELRTPVTRR